MYFSACTWFQVNFHLIRHFCWTPLAWLNWNAVCLDGAEYNIISINSESETFLKIVLFCATDTAHFILKRDLILMCLSTCKCFSLLTDLLHTHSQFKEDAFELTWVWINNDRTVPLIKAAEERSWLREALLLYHD